jgi:predicted metal-dependent phosphoesterase TrpH
MTARLGRADLHVHTLASDGLSPVTEIIETVEAAGVLDVIGIADHERIDAAQAGQRMAQDRGYRLQVVVGEEISTRGGHLLALFLTQRVRPLRSLRSTIMEVHEQGGLAIPAHPLVPYPLCAQGWVLRRLLDDPDPRAHPDAIEVFNPTTIGRPGHARAIAFAKERGLPMVGNSDAHAIEQVGQGWTTFPGSTAEDARRAIVEGTTHWHGSFHGHGSMVTTFGRQLRKYGRDARAGASAKVLRKGEGRDLGYPRGSEGP